MVLITTSLSDALIESLFNQKLTTNLCYLCIMCHKKCTRSFNTPKYKKMYERNQLIVIRSLKCFDERKINLLLGIIRITKNCSFFWQLRICRVGLMQREKVAKCLLEFYGILSVTIENICKQIIPAANFVIWLAIVNLCKLLDIIRTCKGTT